MADAGEIGSERCVWCPRTAEYFGHRGHRYREMMAAGVNKAWHGFAGE